MGSIERLLPAPCEVVVKERAAGENAATELTRRGARIFMVVVVVSFRFKDTAGGSV